MKRRLNILCILVMLVFCYSVFESAYYMSNAFVSGFEAGMNSMNDKKELLRMNNLKAVDLFPEHLGHLTDSVYNEKSGTYVPVVYSSLLVSVDTPFNVWLKFSTLLCAFMRILLMILSVVLFFKLIVSINRSNIFGWKNVRRLRWLGAVLILNFLCDAIPAGIAAYELSGVFSIAGYSLNLVNTISKLTLVLGLVSLVVGEIFAIGLKMKEEQELTI